MRSPRTRARIAVPGLLLAAIAPLLVLASSCADSVVESGTCSEGLTQCDDECVDTRIDPESCGACGHDCPEGAACEAGACVATCSDLLTDCGGSCVDLGTDSHHCGACGLLCPPFTVCSGGVCNAPCPAELAPCNGGCVDAQNDVENCGGCGVVCAPGEACVGGVCGACPDGLTKCNTQCVDTQTNTLHCGGCGLACAAGFSCEAGMCKNPCGAGETPCNGQCVDTQSSSQHCGACNDPCAMGQECQGGSCECTGGVCGVCSVTDLGSMIPQTVSGSTWNAPDLFYPGCGTSGAGEVAYSFTAPADGSYFFSTVGSSYDTVLSVLSQGCSEMDCNDNFSFDWWSKLVVPMTQGETVYVVVDGMFDQGSYSLTVGEAVPPMCPVGDLGSTVPTTITGSTVGAGDALEPGCGFGLQTADQSYTFTAPADGSYSFDTFGSMLDTILHVRDGSCAGQEIACNNDHNGGWESFAYVTLTAGQTVVVSVEGAYGEEGDFVLNVNSYSPPPCPMQDLGSAVPQTVNGDTTGLQDFLTPSCTSPGSPEMTYSFTAPASGTYSFDTFGSIYDTVLHVLAGTCGGLELGCDDDSMGAQSMVTVSLMAGETVIVAVDGYSSGNYGPFTLHVNQQ